MIFEIDDRNAEKVMQLLQENSINYEKEHDAFASWDGINLHDTLTEIFGRNPSIDGDTVSDEIYRRTPQIVEKLRKRYMYEKSYSMEESPYMQLEGKIHEFYGSVIEKEIEAMKSEGILKDKLIGDNEKVK